jgi:thioredoxin 1
LRYLKGNNMGKYIELTDNNFEATVNSGVSLVDFWAPWCGPCRMIAPVIDKLAEEYEGKANICKVNVDENQDLAVKYAVKSIPTILFMKDGEVVDQLVGATSEQALKEKIDGLL